MTNKSTLVFIYNSFNDPLFQNLVLTYIKTLSGKTLGEFHIITFEQPQYFLNNDEKRKIKQDLKEYRIYWYPMEFHTGKPLLLKKTWDFFRALLLLVVIRIKHNTKIIFSFANVSAAFSVIFAKLFRMKMIVYSFEPHSDFLVELGLWDKSSVKYQLLHHFENLAGHEANFILTGTKYMVEKLKREGSKSKVYRAPTAVDEKDFYFRLRGRNKVRSLLNLRGKKVFIYLGKFGDLYYTYQIPEVCGEIHKQIPNSYFLIVTSNKHSDIKRMFEEYLPKEAFFITGNLSYEEVKNYISAAEIGISGVPFTFSQKYRSPTKVAEYLYCGIPYITTRGVSEDDVYAEKYRVGVVLGNFDKAAIQGKIQLLISFLNESKEEQRIRCRQVGLEYRSKDKIDNLLEEIYKNID